MPKVIFRWRLGFIELLDFLHDLQIVPAGLQRQERTHPDENRSKSDRICQSMPAQEGASRPPVEIGTDNCGEKSRTKREGACTKSRVWGVDEKECQACQGECKNPQKLLAQAPAPNDSKPQETC